MYSDAFLRDRPHKANEKPNRNRKSNFKKACAHFSVVPFALGPRIWLRKNALPPDHAKQTKVVHHEPPPSHLKLKSKLFGRGGGRSMMSVRRSDRPSPTMGPCFKFEEKLAPV